jgi:putative DNA primase/helicase
VDLDACVREEGIEGTAAQLIAELGSYTEVSPSGSGMRILLACPQFHENARREGIEVYSHSRYVIITGHHVAGTPPNITGVSADLLASLVPPAPEQGSSSIAQAIRPEHYSVSDMELWERIFAHDKYGQQHLQRFQGSSSLDRGDHSFTVIRLLNCLARWTRCDPARMRSMILMSPLANDKWLEKRGAGDWLDYQIADAIGYVSRR